MKQPVQLEFEVHWIFRADKMLKDPMGRGIRALGKQVPYRIYLDPCNELLSDKMFEILNPYYISEIHYLNLDHGTYELRIEDLSGWMDIKLKNIRLNTVNIAEPKFSLE